MGEDMSGNRIVLSLDSRKFPFGFWMGLGIGGVWRCEVRIRVWYEVRVGL